MPMLVSTSLHGLVGVALLVISSIGFTNADERTEPIDKDTQPIRLVYLAQPGPGGGGGGGGLKMRTPPPKAERKGPQHGQQPDSGAKAAAAARADAEARGATTDAARSEDPAAGDGTGRADRGGQERSRRR